MSALLKAPVAAKAATEARFTRALYWLVVLHILLVTLGLQGCGGGETEEEQQKDNQPVNCQQRPELCK